MAIRDREAEYPRSLAWAAGLLEGEGSFCMHKSKGRWWYPHVSCGMSDYDILYRLKQVLGVGTIRPKKVLPGRKPMWTWSVTKQTDAIAVCFTLWPFMGERRREQIEHVVLMWKAGSSFNGNP